MTIYMPVYLMKMFYTAFKAKPMDLEAGRRYRYKVLEKGGSQDEMHFSPSP